MPAFFALDHSGILESRLALVLGGSVSSAGLLVPAWPLSGIGTWRTNESKRHAE